MLALIRSLPKPEREARSAAIRARIEALPAWQNAIRVLVFCPLSTEPVISDLSPCATRELYLPRVAPGGLTLHLYTPGAPMERSQFGTLEPADDAPTVPISAFDLALVPGLAFDPDSRVRLGRGGGFYDRLLGALPRGGGAVRLVGVCFAEQLVRRLPAEAHDRSMDDIISA